LVVIFLSAWITQPDSLALGFVENGQLLGYAVRRRCIEGHKIGPLFADTPHIAEQLFLALQQDIPGEAIFLDIAEINPAAEKLALRHKMEPVFSTGRMYLHGQPELAYEKLFGITTFELG
ncbi:MAG: GNAT family N-acetyltransferase, partial [Methyloprofundus sp.]|nr:GNAT family N-acetyltransferase [Methyloprofundus sp.]